MPLAFFLAAVAFSLVIMLPSVVGCLICSLLPAISGWILFVEQHAWSRKHQAQRPAHRFRPEVLRLAHRRYARVWWAWPTAWCGRRSSRRTTWSIHVFLQWPLAGAGLLTMVIVYGAALLSSEQSTRTIYKAAIMRHGLLLHAPARIHQRARRGKRTGPGEATAPSTCSSGCFWQRSRRTTGSPPPRCSASGGAWSRSACCQLHRRQHRGSVRPHSPPQFLSLIALIATMAVLLSFLFVFRESDLIALTEEPESEAESAEDRALASSSDVPLAASDNPRPRFQDRCLEVAAAFELSPKETEVMILFAKGRSAARIQEELFISKGTVSTHLRHIYQKMDVHSKQEMLDVIEGVIRE
ncbi:MAG: response regulator transcription factor [Adlercreutzia equolifaciens]